MVKRLGTWVIGAIAGLVLAQTAAAQTGDDLRQALGLDVQAFGKCVDSGTGAARIRRDMADADTAGARGTPTFFIGLTEPDSSALKAVRVIRGAHPYATFKEAIDGLLASAK